MTRPTWLWLFLLAAILLPHPVLAQNFQALKNSQYVPPPAPPPAGATNMALLPGVNGGPPQPDFSPTNPLKLHVTKRTDVQHEFTGVGTSYGVLVVNQTQFPVTMARGIMIEKQTENGWVETGSVQAINECKAFDTGYNLYAPVQLAPAAKLDVLPWDGYTCGGQCPVNCKGQQTELQIGGPYRFVAIVLPEMKRLTSGTFTVVGP